MDAEALIFIAIFLFGTALGGLLLWKLFDVVRNSIGKNKNIYGEEAFERLAEAFIKHKKETEKRFKNLEAIIADEKQSSQNQIEGRKETIKIKKKNAEKPNPEK